MKAGGSSPRVGGADLVRPRGALGGLSAREGVIFSAHGAPRWARARAKGRG